MFAFAVWDAQKECMVVARDRFGEKPLYIWRDTSQLYFASECRAFLKVSENQWRLSQTALKQYLSFGYVPEGDSVYEGIHKVPPGTYLEFSKTTEFSNVSPSAYWSLKDLVTLQGASSSVTSRFELAHLHELLKRSVRDQMCSDVPLGAFLSGGVDSSLVVALMQSQSPSPVKTFTVAFEEPGVNESAYAKAIATHLKTDHHEYLVTGRVALDLMPKYSKIYDEPFADPSGIPTYILAKFARDHVTVALSGDGGDEVFGGYNRYIFYPKIWSVLKYIPMPLRDLTAQLADLLPDHWLRHIFGSNALRVNSIHKTIELLRAKNLNDGYVRLASMSGRGKLAAVTKSSGKEQLYNELPWLLSGDRTSDIRKMQYYDICSYLPGDVLVKVDRAVMATSLETRAPFLDARVIDYAWGTLGMPMVDGSIGKQALRSLLSQYVPPQLYERAKHGFSVPVGAWLSGPLKSWASDLLASSNLTNRVDYDWNVVRKIWHDHLCGRREEPTLLWTIFSLLSWLDASNVQK